MKVSIRRIELGLCWVAAACFGGCDEDEPPRPPVEETIEPGEFCKLLAGAAQRNLEGTCSEAEKKEPAYRYLTEVARERVTECTRRLEADAQRLTVPAKQARDCAAALDKQSWKELLLWRSVAVVPECRGLIAGKQKAGEACRSDAACVADHFCSGAREGSDGTCKPLVKAKESCEERSGTGMGWAARVSCAQGLHCVMERLKTRHPLGIDMPELREPEPVEGDAGARGLALREAQEFGMIGLLNTAGTDALWYGIDRIVRGLEGETDPGSIGLGFGQLGSSQARNVRMGTLSVSGALPPEVVQRIVRQNFGRLRLCYEKALKKNEKLRGKLTARFEINAEGAVQSAAVAGELKDDAFTKCLEQVFTGLSFPRPETGVVAVRIPLEFELPDKTEPPKDGTCHPALERCGHDGDCAEGTRCHGGKCSADLAAAGGKCDDSGDCSAGLYCKNKSCAARRKDGEPCTSSLQCAGVCGKEGKCVSFCD